LIKQDLLNELKRIICDNTLIVCIGSPLRSDDRAGLILCDKLIEKNVRKIVCEYGLENCIHDIVNVDPRILLVVDAVYSRKLNPGDIVLVEFNEFNLEGIEFTSTHSIPLEVVIEIIKKITKIEKIYLLGIMVKNIDIGLELSFEIENSVSKLADLINSILDKCIENTS